MELAELFQDLDVIVSEQEPLIQNIEQKGEEIHENMQQANVELSHGVKSARGARKKKWICFFIVLVVIIVIAVAVGVKVAIDNSNKPKNTTTTVVATTATVTKPAVRMARRYAALLLDVEKPQASWNS